LNEASAEATQLMLEASGAGINVANFKYMADLVDTITGGLERVQDNLSRLIYVRFMPVWIAERKNILLNNLDDEYSQKFLDHPALRTIILINRAGGKL
jgi:hypothetical protein